MPRQCTRLAPQIPSCSRLRPLVEKHSVNGTDAVILRSALDLAVLLQAAGNDLLLIASDLRLLRAAQAEGLTTLNPEVQSELELDALLGP